jgi:hypothetical protein
MNAPTNRVLTEIRKLGQVRTIGLPADLFSHLSAGAVSRGVR